MSRSNILQFLFMCGRLKRTVRTGWTRYEIDQPESVSDHMYRMALMSTIIPVQERESISVDRLLKMTVVHDLAECIVGDITPHCNVSREEKLRRETEAMDRLCQLIPKENAEEILLLWQEYNTQSTPEAVLCKDFDKFEMLVQAFEYEKEMCKPNKLSEFFESTLGCFSTPLVKDWVTSLCDERQKFAQGDHQSPNP
ncbi:HD domain containing protein 2 [Fasciola hepatica]|uniref:5'-deoxynucleotidase HDDC2 n=1 Tax=Fasciola hepatica TaxID=6192 RepID=A0A4E0RV22_FASHE|nr:HD domain containing protein 2 [Fasciola hepatica]